MQPWANSATWPLTHTTRRARRQRPAFECLTPPRWIGYPDPRTPPLASPHSSSCQARHNIGMKQHRLYHIRWRSPPGTRQTPHCRPQLPPMGIPEKLDTHRRPVQQTHQSVPARRRSRTNRIDRRLEPPTVQPTYQVRHATLGTSHLQFRDHKCNAIRLVGHEASAANALSKSDRSHPRVLENADPLAASRESSRHRLDHARTSTPGSRRRSGLKRLFQTTHSTHTPHPTNKTNLPVSLAGLRCGGRFAIT